MKTLLTLDYELFFGRNTGSVEACIIKPTNELLDIVRPLRAPLVFFVDVAYIAALRREMHKHAQLRKDHDLICRHVEMLANEGHEIQLHIHSHWEDCRWTGDGWDMNTQRYRLHDFSLNDISSLVQGYVRLLKELAGPDHGYAYRAGGWVIQPFEKIRQALLDAGVYIDSTVFAGGKAEGAEHLFDFTQAPRLGHWQFDTDPCVPCAKGPFLEVPIASIDVPPSFYWRFAAHKKLGDASSQPFGDGKAIGPGKADLLKKMLTRTSSVVSMDGYKSTLLEKAYEQYKQQNQTSFVVIGHPKSLSPFSLGNLENFLKKLPDESLQSFKNFRNF
ncbi:hypothetical protein DBR47_03590 [Paucibacter sp. KBW04]|uniref:hypothetical protein n=1 Tax=Paucibacter sp. KBW04 TaxID=2153361 RepID=UPI000F58A13E|nr:hypothetical protein [Paucibacter sp. KBW04]RQO62341.1 hypothetical protein DBR47_03590 [Paucibacter sp. KBW04]